MGRSYLFECPKCTFKATVSGGADDGLDCSVMTVVCRDCRRLYDVITRLRVIDSESSAAREAEAAAEVTPPNVKQVLDQLPLPVSQPFHWAEFPLRCPVLRAHDVEKWTVPGKCPVCASFLEKNGVPFRVWS